jgi:hypothetical protein
VALSTAGAAVLGPYVGRAVLGLWAGSVLLDVDHYLWFCLRHRRLSPAAAVGYFNRAAPRQHSATRVLHSPAAVSALMLLGARRRGLLPVALGMAAHVALDARHEARMRATRSAALERDDFSCQSCGARGSHVGTHVRRQPWLLPSYAPHNVSSLCSPCHEAAHTRLARPRARHARHSGGN